jgi:hypothetical protein
MSLGYDQWSHSRCQFSQLAIGQIWLDESPVGEIDDDVWVDEKLIISDLSSSAYYPNHGVVWVTRPDGSKSMEFCCHFFAEKTLTKIAD